MTLMSVETKEWIDFLRSHAKRGNENCKNLLGKISSRSVLKEIDPAALDVYFKAAGRTWQIDGRRGQMPGPAIKVHDSVVETPANNLQCRSNIKFARNCDISRVIDYDTLFAHLIDPAASGVLYGSSASYGEELRRLSTYGFAVMRDGKTGGPAQLRGRLPVAWVTPSDALNRLRKATKDKTRVPERVRDALGLAQSFSPVFLVELQYPPAPSSPIELRKPCFLDGQATFVFAQRNKFFPWGMTAAVGTMSAKSGLPEAIHTPTEFTSNFKIHPIGQVRRSQGLNPFSLYRKVR